MLGDRAILCPLHKWLQLQQCKVGCWTWNPNGLWCSNTLVSIRRPSLFQICIHVGENSACKEAFLGAQTNFQEQPSPGLFQVTLQPLRFLCISGGHLQPHGVPSGGVHSGSMPPQAQAMNFNHLGEAFVSKHVHFCGCARHNVRGTVCITGFPTAKQALPQFWPKDKSCTGVKLYSYALPSTFL